ncbi:MAG: hypothetical protein NT055_00185 [Nitrospirae bacterium]|nr:hypothetical protein [Nitrospirota bacterium]
MKHRIVFFFCFMSLTLLCAFFIHPVSSEEPQKTSTLEKNKANIIGSIENFEQSLKVAKGCIDEAETESELQRCRESIKIRHFQEVQEKLNEIGLSPDERRMRSLVPER